MPAEVKPVGTRLDPSGLSLRSNVSQTNFLVVASGASASAQAEGAETFTPPPTW